VASIRCPASGWPRSRRSGPCARRRRPSPDLGVLVFHVQLTISLDAGQAPARTATPRRDVFLCSIHRLSSHGADVRAEARPLLNVSHAPYPCLSPVDATLTDCFRVVLAGHSMHERTLGRVRPLHLCRRSVPTISIRISLGSAGARRVSYPRPGTEETLDIGPRLSCLFTSADGVSRT
jgi:hypothetical protein